MALEINLLVSRLLAALRDDVLPLTRDGVREGNKVFGAAVLHGESLELVIAGTNQEVANPLFHGEISCLNRYWALPAKDRPPPTECLFLSTHEPCSMCLSAITWSGFTSFYYLFSYEDTRDEFEIPHDLAMLEEVFRCSDGAYAETNAYWQSHYIMALIEQCPENDRAKWREHVAHLKAEYDVLSSRYQAGKETSDIPLR